VFLLASGNESSSGGVNPTIQLTGSYRYLYITTSAGAGDDDFLLRGVIGRVPEPASLALLASGLAGLVGAAAWKGRRR